MISLKRQTQSMISAFYVCRECLNSLELSSMKNQFFIIAIPSFHFSLVRIQDDDGFSIVSFLLQVFVKECQQFHVLWNPKLHGGPKSNGGLLHLCQFHCSEMVYSTMPNSVFQLSQVKFVSFYQI